MLQTVMTQAAMVFWGIVALVSILGAFTLLVWFGFRMGRQSIDKPLPAIIKPKAVSLVEEDPYFYPMNGYPQSSEPTVDGGNKR